MLGGIGAKSVELPEDERRVVEFERESSVHDSLLRCRIEPHISLSISGFSITLENLSLVFFQMRGLGVGAEDLGVSPPGVGRRETSRLRKALDKHLVSPRIAAAWHARQCQLVVSKPDRCAGNQRAIAGRQTPVAPRNSHVPRSLDPVSFGRFADDDHRDGVEPCPTVAAEFRVPSGCGRVVSTAKMGSHHRGHRRRMREWGAHRMLRGRWCRRA